jgi:hypothetical protein
MFTFEQGLEILGNKLWIEPGPKMHTRFSEAYIRGNLRMRKPKY